MFDPPEKRTLEEAFDDAFNERHPAPVEDEDEEEEYEDAAPVNFAWRNEEG